MKDIFDLVEFGDLKLNSRIVRTGLWESQREKTGNLTPEIYDRYENMAASGVGLIITELFSLYPRDVFSKYTHTLNTAKGQSRTSGLRTSPLRISAKSRQI